MGDRDPLKGPSFLNSCFRATLGNGYWRPHWRLCQHPVRPDNRTELWMELNLGERLLVTEWREDPLEFDRVPKIQIALHPILEAKMDAVTTQRSNLNNILQHRSPQRLDGLQWGLGSGQLPP